MADIMDAIEVGTVWKDRANGNFVRITSVDYKAVERELSGLGGEGGITIAVDGEELRVGVSWLDRFYENYTGSIYDADVYEVL